MKQFVVIYERGEKNWGAYSPDVPGCIATGKTRAEVEKRFRTALRMHLSGLRKAGLPMPEQASRVGRVSVAI